MVFIFIQVQGCRIFGAIPQVQDFRAVMMIESHSRQVKHTIGHSCFHFQWFVKIENFVFIFERSLIHHVNCFMR